MKFGEFCEIQPRVKLEKNQEYSFVPMEDVKVDSNLQTSRRLRTYTGGGAKFCEGDTIFARITPCLEHGKISLVKKMDTVCGFGSTEYFVFRAKPNISTENYLFYLSKSAQITGPAIKSMTGSSGRQRARKEVIQEIDIEAPEIYEQIKIGEALRKYDDLIENNRRRIVLLEEAARLLYREWFVHFRFPGAEHVKIVDGVPEGWEQTNVGKITDFLSRGITPKYDEDGESIVINQKCIRNSKLNLELSRKQSKKIPDAKYVKLGDVLINSTGAGTLGRVAQCQIKKNNLTIDSHVTIARPAEGISVLWYGLLFFSLESHIETMGRGATNQTELSKNDIAELKVLKPNSSLLSEFEEIVAPMVLQVSVLGEMNKQLSKARDLLLPRLMDGRLEI